MILQIHSFIVLLFYYVLPLRALDDCLFPMSPSTEEFTVHHFSKGLSYYNHSFAFEEHTCYSLNLDTS